MVAYEVQLPMNMTIHNVFHVSLLKAYVEGRGPAPPPVPIEVNGELEYEVEYIIDHRVKTMKRHKRTEYFVKWTGYGAEHCTWEPAENLQNSKQAVQEYWDLHEAKQLAVIRNTMAKY